MNCPIDPKTMEISGKKRIEESIPTIESLTDSKLVIASHQGRVGNTDYTNMAKHAAVLEEMLGRKIRYVEDTIGEAAQSAIRDLKDGEILMLDNLRLCAEENYEFLPEDAAKTIMVRDCGNYLRICAKKRYCETLRKISPPYGIRHLILYQSIRVNPVAKKFTSTRI